MLTNGEMAVADELGIGVVAYAPLGRGVLTDGVRSLNDLDPSDARRGLPRFQPDAFENNRRLTERVRSIAQERNATIAQIALAWVVAEGAVPIPGTRHRARLEENTAAADIALTETERRRLADSFTMREVRGSRDGIDAPVGVDR
jgi:aryl-alcohol dehydrogenase-like predicted oxidoreductase